LTFDDGTQGKLHAFPFDNTQEATILYSSLPYIEFLSLNSGNIVSTEPQELAVGWSNAGSDWGGDGGADPNAGCIGDAPTN
ncbi:MAG: hypothetical protein J6P72_01960, partial [Firmicutes bacterium]|nr:hypothetical protein [Bacillota bacterium]